MCVPNIRTEKYPCSWDFSIGPPVSSHWLGRSNGGFPDFGCLDPSRPQAPHQCVGAQGGNVDPPTLNLSISGPSGFMIATDNTTVVAYINKQGGTHSHTLLRLVVDLFLWLQSHDIAHLGQTNSGLPQCDSRPVISAEPAHHDRVEPPPRSSESNIQTIGNSSSGHVCHSPQCTSSPVYISSSGAKSTNDRCSVTGVAGKVDVHVSTVSPAHQSHSEAQEDDVILIAPWWPSQPWFPHLLRLCVDYPRFFQ